MSEPSTAVILPSRMRAGAGTFGVLFLLESLTRAFNSGVLSIQAYDILGASQKVSLLGSFVSGTVLIVTLFLPVLFSRMRRRWAYTIGCLLLIAGSAALSTYTLPGQITGTMMRNIGASITNVTLQLYILDHIKKADLTTSEPQSPGWLGLMPVYGSTKATGRCSRNSRPWRLAQPFSACFGFCGCMIRICCRREIWLPSTRSPMWLILWLSRACAWLGALPLHDPVSGRHFSLMARC